MKFDPFSWSEVKPNEIQESPKGRLLVRVSSPAPLYVSIQGYEALAGFGTDFQVEVSEAAEWFVAAPKDVRVFVFRRPSTSIEPEGEVYTNIDRMPDESGSLAEVTRTMRLFQLQQRAALREIRAERDQLEASRSKADQPSDSKQADPDSEAVTE